MTSDAMPSRTPRSRLQHPHVATSVCAWLQTSRQFPDAQHSATSARLMQSLSRRKASTCPAGVMAELQGWSDEGPAPAAPGTTPKRRAARESGCGSQQHARVKRSSVTTGLSVGGAPRRATAGNRARAGEAPKRQASRSGRGSFAGQCGQEPGWEAPVCGAAARRQKLSLQICSTSLFSDSSRNSTSAAGSSANGVCGAGAWRAEGRVE
jgi:hypothetical protein